MLTGKQKRELRKLAHHLNPIYQVGKEGVSLNMLEGIEQALIKHELIKVKLLESCDEDIRVVALKISEYTKAEVAQIIGRTIVLYLYNKDGNIKI
ncbi:ribosome assembly RNA-binding protein YhbY [Beduini massiliensis]|uniref:ribosome assembly RNA-binding protein YhbY n=1 Tax=Beduini massiliensis TaxID=1585974 RepID=UPI00059A8820|nr:ribosome assembly RNA-binding protein YhbY [Beduini massiliensis]